MDRGGWKARRRRVEGPRRNLVVENCASEHRCRGDEEGRGAVSRASPHPTRARRRLAGAPAEARRRRLNPFCCQRLRLA